jgi:hypothetical protein
MNETIRYKIQNRLKGWVQKIFQTFLSNFEKCLNKSCHNFVHFAWHGWEWVKMQQIFNKIFKSVWSTLAKINWSFKKSNENFWYYNYTKFNNCTEVNEISQHYMISNDNFIHFHWITFVISRFCYCQFKNTLSNFSQIIQKQWQKVKKSISQLPSSLSLKRNTLAYLPCNQGKKSFITFWPRCWQRSNKFLSWKKFQKFGWNTFWFLSLRFQNNSESFWKRKEKSCWKKWFWVPLIDTGPIVTIV